MLDKHINIMFTYHKPGGNQADRYDSLRAAGRVLARQINSACPDSPEKTTAINKVREAIHWASASIACNE